MFSRVFGALEYHLRPEKCDWWGGPFNGQHFRQQIFSELMRVCDFEYIVETGTFCGTTTLFFARSFNVPVYTSECNSRFFGYSRRRLRLLKNIRQYLADSRTFLRKLDVPKKSRTIFYLDAHWKDDLPLAEETEYIFSSFKNYVVMIDDFSVSDDDGYTFDDFGVGKQLSLRDFPFHKKPRIHCYFPAKPGREESGSRRGCVVIASETLSSTVDRLGSLRKIGGTVAEAA